MSNVHVLFPPPPPPPLSQPKCPNCGSRMRLSLIEPDRPGFDRRTLDCLVCEHGETRVMKIDEPAA